MTNPTFSNLQGISFLKRLVFINSDHQKQRLKIIKTMSMKIVHLIQLTTVTKKAYLYSWFVPSLHVKHQGKSKIVLVQNMQVRYISDNSQIIGTEE